MGVGDFPRPADKQSRTAGAQHSQGTALLACAPTSQRAGNFPEPPGLASGGFG